ncbi:heme transporter [Gordonia sp. VNQ95]|jgi:putative hemin transport protein|uniref:heme transporter n=1 Tax=Gordonia TaxID=2053 RepID=UPI0032B60472
MPANPDDVNNAGVPRRVARQAGDALPRPCGRDPHCRCTPGQSVTSDLETLLATPGFGGTLLNAEPHVVTSQLPHLDQVVGVTVAGPVVMNDVGVHVPPVLPGGPIKCDSSRITLRLNPVRLGSALVSEPAANIPPTLRLFDANGNTSHATYLTERSDRLAFEAIALTGADPAVTHAAGGPDSFDEAWAIPEPASANADQIVQFDSILADGGLRRRTELPGLADAGVTRVEDRRVIGALEHAALLGMQMTMVTAAPGCLQMRHDQLDGAREHRGQMVIASGSCRAMINFGLVTECWITWSEGVWGRTGSIELYDRHGGCSMILTQTGPVPAPAFEAWDHLLNDLVS